MRDSEYQDGCNTAGYVDLLNISNPSDGAAMTSFLSMRLYINSLSHVFYKSCQINVRNRIKPREFLRLS
jgi:hypothetical protein